MKIHIKRILTLAFAVLIIVVSGCVKKADKDAVTTSPSEPAQTEKSAEIDVLKILEGSWIELAYYEGPVTINSMNPFRIGITNGKMDKGYGHHEASIYEVPLLVTKFADNMAELVCDIPNMWQDDKSYVEGDRITAYVSGDESPVTIMYYNGTGTDYTLVRYTGVVARYEVEATSTAVTIRWSYTEPYYNVYRSETEGEKGGLVCEIDGLPCEFTDNDIKPDGVYYYSFYYNSWGEEYPEPIKFGNDWQIKVDLSKHN